MNIYLQDLFQYKKEFDQKIEKEMGLQGVFLLNKKIRATLVELGELLNESPSITKYWSKKCVPKSEKVARFYAELYQQPLVLETENPKLEEYVDVLQFLLTIGLDLRVEADKEFALQKTEDVESQFDELFYNVSLLFKKEHQTHTHYHHVMSLFFGLGEMLGYGFAEIKQAYLDKTQINHSRLLEGY